ncbi:zinc ribbon domain-containing protein [Bradyrhizobium sp. C9]|uniref:Zn-ribbon domain-containing OB-fold protein n=1 Tax=Bradyrhizobium sp. C9 TaxID=142585 RepID=UPI000BE9CBCB|nr:zinc ribbon domain-containing protein [Bradyrhizobium sp. C9]PDT76815.1 DNA-binding protein [Bradyrhizobium sp. C9]
MSGAARAHHLPAGLPIPVSEPDGLSAPYWAGLRLNRLLVQRCDRCTTWQFGPEWICHHCHAFDLTWTEVEPIGRIFSWERVWHPSHAALKQHGPYVALLVELPHAGRVRMVGNLLGDPRQTLVIGTAVAGVFEHHLQSDPAYSLLQWRLQQGPAVSESQSAD